MRKFSWKRPRTLHMKLAWLSETYCNTAWIAKKICIIVIRWLTLVEAKLQCTFYHMIVSSLFCKNIMSKMLINTDSDTDYELFTAVCICVPVSIAINWKVYYICRLEGFPIHMIMIVILIDLKMCALASSTCALRMPCAAAIHSKFQIW